ncbi:chemotaxis protein CheV [bacterium]|nr:chemotaxis protein CheV [bacterium]
MAGILEGVDQRTKLAGHNRLELLLFRLNGPQRFGINVFKVKEVIQCPLLTQIPNSHPVVCGVAHLRGLTIPVLDLSRAICGKPMIGDRNGYVIVTEYNRKTQGFLVHQVDRIINMKWDEIKPPPRGTGKHSYLTAVTEVDKELIGVVDVEKVMNEVIGCPEYVSDGIIDDDLSTTGQLVLVVDDSSVARNQVKRVLDQLNVASVMAKDGIDALAKLNAWIKDGKNLSEFLAMIISDIEMPRMDGYTLTTKIRKDAEMSSIFIILHTSLSGVFNQAMVEKVGADQFLAKYEPDELAAIVQKRLKQHFNQRMLAA